MSEPIPQPETTTEPAAPAKTLEELLAEAEAKVQEQRDAWLRALADAENARKRAQTDIASAHKYGVERLAEALVPVMDSLQAALADQESIVHATKKGTLKSPQAFKLDATQETSPGNLASCDIDQAK